MNKRRIRGGNDDRKVVRMKYDLDYLFEYYYSVKKSEGISEVTLTTYIYNYKGFCEYLDLKGIAHDIRLLNAEIGRSYVLWLRFEKKCFSNSCSVPEKSKTIGLLPKSVNTRIKNIKAMFRYLQDIEIIDADPLTTNNFRHRLKIYAKEAGITKRVHPHLIRHTGATLFLEEGRNTSHLQKILGRVDGRMTAHYTHLSNKSVKESHDKNSPA